MANLDVIYNSVQCAHCLSALLVTENNGQLFVECPNPGCDQTGIVAPAPATAPHCAGCLAVNSTIEFGAEAPPEVRAALEGHFAEFRAALESNLRNAIVAGDLRADLDVESSVELLLGVVIALAVSRRASGDPTTGRPLATSVRVQVQSWRAA